MTYKHLQILTLVWLVLLVVGSLSPLEVKLAAGTETTSYSPAVQQQTVVQHRIGHYLAFGFGAVLLTAVGLTLRSRLVYCLALIALGCLLEWLQHIIYHCRLETWDMRDDAIAIALSCAVTLALGLGSNLRRQAVATSN